MQHTNVKEVFFKKKIVEGYLLSIKPSNPVYFVRYYFFFNVKAIKSFSCRLNSVGTFGTLLPNTFLSSVSIHSSFIIITITISIMCMFFKSSVTCVSPIFIYHGIIYCSPTCGKMRGFLLFFLECYLLQERKKKNITPAVFYQLLMNRKK